MRTQAEDVLAMLGDAERCQVLLVTLPETTPVNELIETAFAIEERVGVQLGPVVVNQVDGEAPPPDPVTISFGRARVQVDDAVAAAEFRRARHDVQAAELDRLRAEVPLPQIHVAALPVAGLRPDDVARLARELAS